MSSDPRAHRIATVLLWLQNKNVTTYFLLFINENITNLFVTHYKDIKKENSLETSLAIQFKTFIWHLIGNNQNFSSDTR